MRTARLSNGEFVVNAAATRRNLPLLEAINSGQAAAMAKGGLVVPSLARGASSRSASAAAPVVNVTVDAPAGTAVESTRQNRNSTGGYDVIMKLVDQRINKQLASGATDQAMRGRYGTRATKVPTA